MAEKIEDNDVLAFQKRLRLLASELGGLTVLSEKTGIKYGTLQKYLLKSGAPDPTRAVIKKIIDNCNLSARWLLAGEGHMFGVETDNMRAIPLFDLQAYESHVEENTIEKKLRGRASIDAQRLPFASAALKIDLSTFDSILEDETISAESLVCFKVRDEDMAPQIPQNTLVLVDISNTQISNGTYLVKMKEPEGYSVTLREIQTAGPDLVHLLAPSAIDRTMAPIELKHQMTLIGRVFRIGLQKPPRISVFNSYADHRAS
jgi:hypothetical protein